jgi:hypothetical protein
VAEAAVLLAVLVAVLFLVAVLLAVLLVVLAAVADETVWLSGITRARYY